MGKDVPIGLHAPFTIVTLLVFVLAIQQLCGSPLDKVKVSRYRITSMVNAFIVLIISISLNINLEQNAPDSDDNCDDYDTAFAELVRFIKTMQVLNIVLCLVLGYWFLVDAVRAAFKATRGINEVKPPAWIQKFWLVFICIELTVLILCYIFAFATTANYFLIIGYLLIFIAAVLGSAIILGSVIRVFLSIQNAIRQNNATPDGGGTGGDAKRVLKNAQSTLRIMLIIGSLFLIGSLATSAVTLAYLTTTTYNSDTLKCTLGSRIFEDEFGFITYMIQVNGFNLCLIAWTYRASNLNYCCYCWVYQKYTTEEHHQTDIDTNVICYKCCPHMLENAEAKRLDILAHPSASDDQGEDYDDEVR